MKESTHLQITAFVLTFLANAARHASIESWYMEKPEISGSLYISSVWLGAMDSLFLIAYALGNYGSGLIGDRFPLRIVISSSLLLTSVVYFLLVASVTMSVETPELYLSLFLVMGLTSSAIWPCTVAVMGNWNQQTSKGLILGLWSVNNSLGNIIGSQISGIFLQYKIPWVIPGTIFCVFLASVGVITLICLVERPYNALVPVDTSELKESTRNASFAQTLLLPGVLEYSLTFACIKSLNYSLVMWLPYYLNKQIEIEGEFEGAVAGVYDVGGIAGAVLLGFISDKLKDRVFVITPVIAGILPLLLLLSNVQTESVYMLFLIIPLLGVLVGGTSSLISTTVASDLAQGDHGYDVKASIAGIIDGSGGFCAGLSQLVIGKLEETSWKLVFYFLISLTTIATFAISRRTVLACGKN